jgi:hypothetical protein
MRRKVTDTVLALPRLMAFGITSERRALRLLEPTEGGPPVG